MKYGAIGTAETAASTALWFGPGKVAEMLGPDAQLTGKASWLFGRSKFGQQGILNRGLVRVGWGWKGTGAAGRDVFRIGVGKPGGFFHGHMDF